MSHGGKPEDAGRPKKSDPPRPEEINTKIKRTD
jgi:hypothetical protein